MRLLAALAAVAVTTLGALTANAGYTFTLATCSPGTTVSLSFSLQSAADYLTKPGCTSNYIGACPHYGTNQDVRAYFHANTNVKKVQFRYDLLATEMSWDYLYLEKWNGSDWAALHTYNGTYSVPFWGTLFDGGVYNIESLAPRFHFTSDTSTDGPGFAVGAAKVWCAGPTDPNLSQADPPYTQPLERHTGVLLAQHDYVRFQAPAFSDHQTFAVWPGPGATADFDLYARCNAPPTPAAYDFRSAGGTGQEFLHLTSAACPSPGVWHIAVHAYSGSGQFNFAHSMHKASRHWSFDAGRAYSSTLSTLDATYQDRFRTAARVIYAATEGQQYIEKITIHGAKETAFDSGLCGNPPVHCDSMVDFGGTGGQTRGTGSGRTSFLATEALDYTYSHEWSHRWLSLAEDEYYTASGTGIGCGHSLMTANLWSPPTFCTYLDHQKDYIGQVSTYNTPAWDVMSAAGIITWYPTYTPDAYDYRDFPFSDNSGAQLGIIASAP